MMKGAVGSSRSKWLRVWGAEATLPVRSPGSATYSLGDREQTT